MSEDAVSVATRESEMAIKPSINNLAQGSMFWQPSYLERSAWLEHLPFLFWLVEAIQPRQTVTLGMHQGVAHFGVCQAVSRLHLDTGCYAIHSWRDDTESFEALNDYNSRQYGEFSHLIDSTPSRTLAQFNDGSLDLLILNVAAEEQGIDYLFELWRPKLSSRAVVLIPSVARREPGCEVFRDFEILRARYPGFAFRHGGGLGLVTVGDGQGAMLRNLLGSEESPSAQQVVRDVFARLGRTCLDSYNAREQKAKAEELGATLESQRQQLDDVSHSYEQSRQEAERYALERNQLVERVSLLQEFRDELKAELKGLRSRLDTQYRQQAENTQQLLHFQLEHGAHAGKACQHEAEALEYKDALEAAQEQVAERDATVSDQQSKLDELEQKLSEQQKTLVDKQRSIDTRFQELAVLTEMLEKNEQQREALESQLAGRDKAASDLQARFDELEQKLSKQQTALGDKQREVDERFQELAKLTRMLQDTRQENERLKIEAAEKQTSIDERFRELAILTEMLETNEQQRETLEKQLEKSHKSLEVEKSGRTKLEAKHREKGKVVERQARELADLVEQLEAYRATQTVAAQATISPDGAPNHLALGKKKRLTREEKKVIKRHVTQLEKAPWFDANWYLEQYPDVAEHARMRQQPARHYLLYGAFEARNPGPDFDSSFYLASYADVRASGMNPLLHFLKFGQTEQRETRAK